MKKTNLFLIPLSVLLLAGCDSTNSSSDKSVEESSSSQIELKLSTPTIKLDGNLISWERVEHASGYCLYENDEVKYNHLNTLSYEISVDESGTYSYYIVALDRNNSYLPSEKSNAVSYTYEKPVALVAPRISLNDKTISWEEVPGAEKYCIYSNGEYLIDVTSTSYTLSFSEVGGYNIQVQAKRGDELSPFSNTVIYKNVDGISLNTSTSWNRTTLYNEWIRSGDFDTGVGEGFDMKAGATAFVYHAISSETRFLKVSIRNFVREGETNPKFFVYVDGKVVRANDSTTDYVTLNSDSPIDFIYDLSLYVGENVFIKFYEAAATHCCITSVKLLERAGATLSENTSWENKDSFFADWYTSSVNSINEGPDFAGNGSAAIKINLTEEKRYFTVTWRMFVNQDTDKARVLTMVDKNTVKAIGVTTEYVLVEAAEGDPHFTYIYDFSDYIGSTVTITMTSINKAVNHCVFLNAKLSASNSNS